MDENKVCECLNNEAQLDGFLDGDSDISSEVTLESQVYSDLEKVIEIISGESKLESISIDGEAIPIDESKNANIPRATKDKLGVVKVDEEMSDLSDNVVQNNVVKEYVDKAKSDLTTSIADINAKLGSTNEEVGKVGQSLADTNEALLKTQGEVNLALNEIEKTNSNVKSIEGVVLDNSSQIADANGKIDDINKKIGDINVSISDKASLSEENLFDSKQTFNGELEINGVVEANRDINLNNSHISITDDEDDRVTTYFADQIISVSGEEPKSISIKFPDKSGTLLTNSDDVAYKGDIPNVSKFITKAVDDLINYYTKGEVDSTVNELQSQISAIPKFAISVVSDLPSSEISETTIYLLKTSTTERGNLYTEYIYVDGTWESLGTQTLDLSGYATTNWVEAEIANFLTETQITTLVASALTEYSKTSEFSKVAFSGALADATQDETHRVVTDMEKKDWNEKASRDDIPSKISDLDNDKGYITGYTETDPTVPSWAKTKEKPEYDYSEIKNTPDLSEKLTKNMFNTYVGNIDACSDSDGNFGQCSNIYNNDGSLYAGRKFVLNKNDFIQEGEDADKKYSISSNIARVKDVDDKLSDKVDKVEGKHLSTEDFTSEEKTKLEELKNYDDTEIRELLSDEAQIRQNSDTSLKGEIQDLFDNYSDLYNITDKSVITSIEISQSSSENSLDATKTNIQSGVTSKTSISLPNASDTDAGIMTAMEQKIGGIKRFSNDIYIGKASQINAEDNGGMEFGRRDGVSGTPYIDFHANATPTDYDARILVSGGSGDNVASATVDIFCKELKVNNSQVLSQLSVLQETGESTTSVMSQKAVTDKMLSYNRYYQLDSEEGTLPEWVRNIVSSSPQYIRFLLASKELTFSYVENRADTDGNYNRYYLSASPDGKSPNYYLKINPTTGAFETTRATCFSIGNWTLSQNADGNLEFTVS